MMFDETQVFEGLTAWFSTSVPASLKSRWGTSRYVCLFMVMHVNLAVFLFHVYVYLISSEKWGTCRKRVQWCRLHFQQQCLCKRYVKVRLKTKFLYLITHRCPWPLLAPSAATNSLYFSPSSSPPQMSAVF